MAKPPLHELFSNAAPTLDADLLDQLEHTRDPRHRYLLAITPRSGSSYLCDLMQQTNLLGSPGEHLSHKRIAINLGNIPARTPDEYLRNLCRALQSKNGVTGLKVSWYQFRVFSEAMENPRPLTRFQYIYLYRRNRAAQAVSLYRATATKYFHTDAPPTEAAVAQSEALAYDFPAIDHWYRHIQDQEHGRQRYFDTHRIFPLCIAYEDLEEDAGAILRRLATFLNIRTGGTAIAPGASAYTRMADQRSFEWTMRYMADSNANGPTTKPPA